MWVLILGVIMVFFGWMQAAYGKLQKHKVDARNQWVRIDALLQTRADRILKLISVAEHYDFDDRNLLADIYELEGGYAKSDDREVISEKAEAVTPLLDRVFEESGNNTALTEDEEFQELKQNLEELEEEIQFQSAKYNQHIDLYNQHREKPSIRLQVSILGAVTLKGFHIRGK